MTTITVTKDDAGKLRGFTDKDQRAYARFKGLIDELEVGELFTLETWFPRNGKLHRLHFAMLAVIFDAQEQYADPEQLRFWLQVGAGHCTYAPGPEGRMVAIPKSISYSSIDDAEFQVHHEAVKAFLRTERARRFLWPHLGDEQTYDTVETLLRDFEEDG